MNYSSAQTAKTLQEYEKRLESEKKKIIDAQAPDPRASTHLYAQDIRPILAAQKQSDVLVIVGIGGSNLGVQAIERYLYNEKTIYYADTIDPRDIHRLLGQLQKEYERKNKVELIIISKSGTTTETSVNYELLKNQQQTYQEPLITTITEKNTPLYTKESLIIPAHVGGRYSVFSPVGLYPLAQLGINIQHLLAGAKQATQINDAVHVAADIHATNKPVLNLFFFDKESFYLGQWVRQLIAESLGKNAQGMLPTISIGTTDLHSIAQRALDGPDDTHTIFVRVNTKHTQQVMQPYEIDTNSLYKTIYEATQEAYTTHNRTYSTIELEPTEESVGAFMQTWMNATMYLAALLEINAFDQPAVETYKQATKKRLLY